MGVLRNRRLHILVISLITTIYCLQIAPCAQAQAPMFDATIKIVNGTTGQPGAVDTITLINQNAERAELASLQYQVGEAVFNNIRVYEGTPVLVHGVSEGVDFYTEVDGLALKTGRATLHIFDKTTDMDGVEVRGMNLVLRQSRQELQVEYIWSIVNRSRPQKCVLGDPNTLEVLVPSNAQKVRFQLQSAPRMQEIESRRGGSAGYQGVATILRPGQTSIGLTYTVPYPNEASIPVGANMAVRSWSILTSPSTLWVSGARLENDEAESVSGFQRKIGPELAAEERYEIKITGGTAARVAAAEQAHEQEQPADEPAPEEDDDQFPWVVVLPSFVVVLIIVGRQLRKRFNEAAED